MSDQFDKSREFFDALREQRVLNIECHGPHHRDNLVNKALCTRVQDHTGHYWDVKCLGCGYEWASSTYVDHVLAGGADTRLPARQPDKVIFMSTPRGPNWIASYFAKCKH